jgi:hypothetical protein
MTIKLFVENAEVEPGTPIELNIGWLCSAPEHVADFLASVALTGSLDGQPLQDMDDYWGEIVPTEGPAGYDGEFYISNWFYPLGVLSPGTHIAEVRAILNWAVTDGFDIDANGVPDEYSGDLWDYTIRIIVEE